MKQLGQYAPPRHAIDTEAGPRLALDRLAAVDPPPQALVFTGDLADKAEPAAYARLREIVEPAAAAMGAEVVWVMGNHDERSDYALGLFGEASDAPQDRVHDVDGLRIISLDSSVPGYHHGELTDAQLTWLGDVLAGHLHFRPIPSSPASRSRSRRPVATRPIRRRWTASCQA